MSTRMHVIEGGVQDDLRQVLFGIFSAEVAAAPDAQGHHDAIQRAKYADGDRDAFVALLFGRNLRDHVLWLCHLIRAAGHLEQSYHSVFFSTPACAHSVKALFQSAGIDANSRPVSLSGRQLTVSYEDGPYVLHLQFVSTLIALFELLLEADFDGVHAIVDTIASGVKTRQEMLGHAKLLQTTLQGYLNRHLPTRQAARKQAALLDYLATHAGGAVTSECISDAHVLEFWREAIERQLADFRTFSSVVECFENLLEALNSGQLLRRIEDPLALDSEHENGWSADSAYADGVNSERYEADDAELLVAEIQSAKPAGIRYFNSNEQAKALRRLLACRVSIRHRPRTYLRYLLFGGHQARITNTLRHDCRPESVHGLVETEPASTYQALQSVLHKHYDGLALTAVATAHLLLLADHPQALYFLPQVLEESVDTAGELSGLSTQALLEAGIDWGEARSNAQQALTEHCLALLRGDSELARDTRARLREAFNRVNRSGFNDDACHDTDMLETHAQTAPALARMLRISKQLLAALVTPQGQSVNWASAYDEDVVTFRNLFKRIYGDAA